jgi:RHS repeat-associated protein
LLFYLLSVSRTLTTSNSPKLLPLTSIASFGYDGDGKRVISSIGASTTYFVGNIYEVANGVVTKYYYAGAQRIATRSGSNGVVSYLLGDHLGSTSITTDAAGLVSSEQRYTAWGEVRYSSGSVPTKYQFTGQYSNVADFGMLFYNARWYDNSLGRFAQADTVVPGGVQGLDRYAGMANNPLKYVDPSGHITCLDDGYCGHLNDYGYQKHIYINAITEVYKWNLKGNWNLQELEGIYQAGYKIQTYVDTFTHGKGLEWMNAYLGGGTFEHGGLPGGYSFVTGTTIHVDNASWNNGKDWTTIVHEMGHVWDNNSANLWDPPIFSHPGHQQSCWAVVCGGGDADELTYELGGSAKGIRFINGTSGIPEKYQWAGYGDRGTAEYFAEAFRYMIYDPKYLPDSGSNVVMDIMQSTIGVEAGRLP